MTDRFFLKSTAIENFKAVRRSGTMAFTPLTVFIGNNGSGKSSLIEALETYRSIVLDGLDAALGRWHGIEYIENQRAQDRRKIASGENAPRERTLAFRLKGRWGAGTFQVRLDASQDLGTNQVGIENELIEFSGLGRRYVRDRTGRCESYRDAGHEVAVHLSSDATGVSRPTRPHVSRLDRETIFLPGESAAPPDWKETVRRWQFLALEPSSMGEPARQRMTGGPPMLNRDGSNLGQYLHSLRESSVDAFGDLLGALKYVLPYSHDVHVVMTREIERMVYLEMTEEAFMVPGWLLSTGTLRILALLACLRHPDPPPLLVVEEIENGLDPRTIHLLVEEFRAAIAAKKTQIIVTTHSPYLLDLLDLSHIVVVERVDGELVFSRPDKEQLREWSKSFAPGRLYTMGRLTRNP
ncbi:MAG: AAA family ATPase [Isosphaeraceae bacterium]